MVQNPTRLRQGGGVSTFEQFLANMIPKQRISLRVKHFERNFTELGFGLVLINFIRNLFPQHFIFPWGWTAILGINIGFNFPAFGIVLKPLGVLPKKEKALQEGFSQRFQMLKA